MLTISSLDSVKDRFVLFHASGTASWADEELEGSQLWMLKTVGVRPKRGVVRSLEEEREIL